MFGAKLQKKSNSAIFNISKFLIITCILAMTANILVYHDVFAQNITHNAIKIDKGDTVWIILSTILVLLMSIPGLGLFYGGLVRAKNMLSTLMQVSIVASIGMIAWVFWGYSLSFTNGGAANAFIGGFSKAFLNGVTIDSIAETFSPNVGLPELVFMAFQMAFACITAAVVLGGLAERMKFSAVCIFAVLWPLLSYYPIAHMAWYWAGATSAIGQSAASLSANAGLTWGWGLLDYAGGTVVEINCGISALVGCIILGKRESYRNEPIAPHSLTLTFVGAGLLWFGWFGFNAGSALEANKYAVLATVNTMLATAAAGMSWASAEWIVQKRPSMLGFASGVIAGLVAITPAAGFIGPMSAIALGLIVSPICLVFCAKVKMALKYDDSLDAFGIHGIGGIVGTIATGILVAPSLGGTGIIDYSSCTINGCNTLDYNMLSQVWIQIKSVLVTILWAGTASTIVFLIIKYAFGLRVSSDVEEEGLDIAEHGERAYHL